MYVVSSTGTAPESPSFEFSGGALCLDFINTLPDRPPRNNEKLAGFADLLRWGSEDGIVDTSERRDLERRALRQPGKAGATLRQAVALREELYRLFNALAAGRRCDPREVVALNRALGESLPHLVLTESDGVFRWDWKRPASRLDRLLWPVVRSVADLLASNDAGLVRECASDRCSWMFLDRSRTRRRRWCDMKTCGNRAKARRHYRRSKSKRSTAD